MTARWDRLPEGARVVARPRRPVLRVTVRCHGCGDLLENVTWKAAERHADTHGGARLEFVSKGEQP